MDEEELPPEFSDLLGQLVYLAGRTDNLLGALTPAKADLPEGNRGLGGERLVKALQPLATPGAPSKQSSVPTQRCTSSGTRSSTAP